MNATIQQTVKAVESASATLDATINRAADLVSATFRDRAPLERLAAEIEEAKDRAAQMRGEAQDLLAGFASWMADFEDGLTVPVVEPAPIALPEAPSIEPAAQTSAAEWKAWDALAQGLDSPAPAPQASEETVATAALPAAEEAPAAPLAPARFPCHVCGADMGFDAPSGVCSEACLRKGQGLAPVAEESKASDPEPLTPATMAWMQRTEAATHPAPALPTLTQLRRMNKQELIALAISRGHNATACQEMTRKELLSTLGA